MSKRKKGRWQSVGGEAAFKYAQLKRVLDDAAARGDVEWWRALLVEIVELVAKKVHLFHVDEEGRSHSLLDLLPDGLIGCLSVDGEPLEIVPAFDPAHAEAVAEQFMKESPAASISVRTHIGRSSVLTTPSFVPRVTALCLQLAPQTSGRG